MDFAILNWLVAFAFIGALAAGVAMLGVGVWMLNKLLRRLWR